eukprot:5618850-Prymnesium_polylepis.1
MPKTDEPEEKAEQRDHRRIDERIALQIFVAAIEYTEETKHFQESNDSEQPAEAIVPGHISVDEDPVNGKERDNVEQEISLQVVPCDVPRP